MRQKRYCRAKPGKTALAALALACILLFSACAGTQEPVRRQLFALDTIIDITVYGPQGEAGAQAAQALLYQMDAMLDVYDPESELSRLNAAGGSRALSPDLAELWACSETMYRRTGGAFEPSIQPLVALWGFGTEHPARPDGAAIQAALERVDFSQAHREGNAVTLPAGMEVSFGAIAKGYIAQKMAETLREAGVESAILSLGGNVQSLGLHPDGSPWEVAIVDPLDTGRALGVLTVGEAAVVTSGGYQRYFQEDGVTYHHILDPRTGAPAESGLRSVTVVCENGAAADALSTALFILGEEAALAHRAESELPYELVLVTEDGRVVVTGGLNFQLEGDDYAYVHVD